MGLIFRRRACEVMMYSSFVFSYSSGSSSRHICESYIRLGSASPVSYLNSSSSKSCLPCNISMNGPLVMVPAVVVPKVSGSRLIPIDDWQTLMCACMSDLPFTYGELPNSSQFSSCVFVPSGALPPMP